MRVSEAKSAPLPLPELTRRMAAGDEAAYGNFYHAYVDRLSRYLLVLSAGDEDAMREALQATLQRVVRHVRKFEDEATFWSWLTVLARSAFRDEWRRKHRYRSFLERFAIHAETESAVDSSVAEGRLASSLKQGLETLADDERALLAAKYYERRTVRELAEQFETTEKAVESKLAGVRAKLKQEILRTLNHDATT